MNYVVWDLETDSADTNWLTILEIGAILLDANFKEIERFSARCRIPQDRVPSATALCINRSNIDLLTKLWKKNYLYSEQKTIIFIYKKYSKIIENILFV